MTHPRLKPQEFSEMVADNAGMLKETTAPFPQFTVREVRSIRTPAMVVWGELSAPWDSKINETLSRSVPACESARIAGAGRFRLVEKPGEVNDQVSRFLLKHA